jgi:divalent metal cation (Fe/Co/Zn/Cd) transporter
LDGVNDVTVHMEVQREVDASAADIFATIRHSASQLGLVVHEAWVQSMEGDLMVEMHVGVKPELTLADAHRLVDGLEQEIRDRLPQVKRVHTHIELADPKIHVLDPAPVDIDQLIRNEVEQAVDLIPSLGSPRNISVRRDRGQYGKLFVSLDCTVQPDIPVGEAHDLASQLERELNQHLGDGAEVSVHLEPSENR